MPHDDAKEHEPDNSFSTLRPRGSKIKVKTPTGSAIYELTPTGWKLIGEEKE